jgi:hypothetical protein
MRAKRLSETHRANIGKAMVALGIKPPVRMGEQNNKWKGDAVGYRALHDWVVSRFGRADQCEECGATKPPNPLTTRGTTYKRYFEWANISGTYLRVRSDWKKLCSPCHKAYDRK